MNYKLVIATILSINIPCAALTAMEITSRKATHQDAPQIMELMEHAAQTDDAKKIVILPHPFREPSLKHAIDAEKLYVVASKNDTVIGYSKCYIISEHDKEEILRDELQAIGSHSECAYSGIVGTTEYMQKELPPFDASETLCIYKGGDYTVPEHRGKGLNHKLTDFSLDSIMHDTSALLNNKTYKHIALVFGLTAANAGNGIPGNSHDRTQAIAASYRMFLSKLLKRQIHELEQYRFKACMPAFAVVERDGTYDLTVISNPERPDFGVILRYSLPEEKE